jgi:sugar/nucleoside kinase (ribokinase family)
MICVGRDWVGKEIIAFLREKGLNTSLVTFNKLLPTGFSVIITAAQDREHTIFTYKGATTQLRISTDLHQVKTDWFYLSPLSIKNWVPEVKLVFDEVARHQERTNKHRIKLGWNPGKRQLQDMKRVSKYLSLVDVLFINRDEAIELSLNLFGRKVQRRRLNQGRYLLDTLKTTGIKNLVITAGAKGVYGLDQDGKYYYKPNKPIKKIADTVGAGDSFASGFLAAFHRYGDFERALTLGSRNSASVITRIGAQNGLLKVKLK